MWSLLWTRLAKKFGFWLKLVAVTSFLHVFLFFMFFFVYGHRSILSIDINKSILSTGAPIIFMNVETGVSVGAKKGFAKNKNINGQNKKFNKKENIKKKIQKKEKVKGSIALKKEKKRQLLEQSKKLRDKKLKEKKLLEKKLHDKKIQEKKEQEKKLRDKELEIKRNKEKIAQEKELEAQKLKESLEKKKQELKKIEEAKKLEKATEENKKLQDNINIEQEHASEEKVSENSSQEKCAAENITINVKDGVVSSNGSQDQNAVYIGQHEIETLKMQYEIEKEVVKYWRPPEGLSKDLSCVVNILIDWAGKVTQVRVVKSSGVLMYDISARVAASKLVLPSLSGKDVNIVFNQ